MWLFIEDSLTARRRRRRRRSHRVSQTQARCGTKAIVGHAGVLPVQGEMIMMSTMKMLLIMKAENADEEDHES